MDPYTNPDAQPQETIQAMATRLEERGQHPAFLEFINAYASDIPNDRPIRLLEIGCGTGVVLRHLKTKAHGDSVFTGADISEKLLATAHALGEGTGIQWHKTEGTKLPYPAESFDIVLMHTLLSHVPEPADALREARRILAPKGRLIIFDADHAATTFGLADYALSRDIDLKLVSAIATHPDICRQIPRLLKASNFKLQTHRSHTLSECGTGDFWLSSVRGFARLIPALKILPQDEGEEWVAQMLASHESNTFFAAGTFYAFHSIREF